MFLGFSPEHSSLVPLVLNIRTGKITPCYHAIFDDAFSTVASITADTDVDTAWQTVLSLTREHYLEFEDYLDGTNKHERNNPAQSLPSREVTTSGEAPG